jgi:hypothetical protein
MERVRREWHCGELGGADLGAGLVVVEVFFGSDSEPLTTVVVFEISSTMVR